LRQYVARRFLLLVPTLFLASLFIFAIIQLAPGDPVQMMLGSEATPQQIADERERLGLDKPAPYRYAVWLGDVARLNLGRSLVNKRPSVELVADAFPNTLRLTLTALAIAIALGFTSGVVAAVRANQRLDLAITSFASLGLALPSFFVGIMLIYVFAVALRWLPPSGIGDESGSFVSNLRYMILPVATIALGNLAVLSRFVRSSMLDVLGADYVRTARAKGLREGVVVGKHALRNALLPVVTVLGVQFGKLLGGAVITESVFAYPGIGRLVVMSIQNRDYPVVQATLMLVVLIFLLTNIAVDVSYGYLDPRVRMGGGRAGA
jgi:ABC-type dipeptide/oligopeptide/nickel transport system permease component